jgi:hypothetical protein
MSYAVAHLEQEVFRPRMEIAGDPTTSYRRLRLAPATVEDVC